MDIGRALTFAFRDPAWPRKLGILMLALLPGPAFLALRAAMPADALLANLQPAGPVGAALVELFGSVLTIPAHGYILRVTRIAALAQAQPLPAWSDAAGLLREGAKALVVITLWSLPFTLLDLVPGFGGDGVLPPRLPWLVLSLALLVLSLALLAASPAAVGRLAVTGSLATGLDLPAVLATVRRNLGGYLWLLLATVVVAALTFGVGAAVTLAALRASGRSAAVPDFVAGAVVVAVIGFAPVQVALAHLTGQVYRRAAAEPTIRHADPPVLVGPRRVRRQSVPVGARRPRARRPSHTPIRRPRSSPDRPTTTPSE